VILGQAEGPLDAELAFVARDYGFEEQAAGRPLVGASGKIFNRALAKAGIERGHCLVTNVVNQQPAGNRWEMHSDDTIRAGVTALESILSASPRRLIVAFGAEAFQACRGRDPQRRPEEEFDGNGITELRGYVFEGPWGPVLAATHPAFVLRTWLPWWPLLCWDLAKAKRWVDGKGGAVSTQEILLTPDIEWPEPPANVTIAMDSETGKHYNTIECVGWAWDAQTSYVAPFNEQTRERIAERLASPHPKVFMNLQFDATIFERNGLRLVNANDDIMILWHTLEPLIAGKTKEKGSQSQKSLRFLMSLLTDQPFHKDYAFQSFEDKMILCGRDCSGTWACWDAMRRRLEE